MKQKDDWAEAQNALSFVGVVGILAFTAIPAVMLIYYGAIWIHSNWKYALFVFCCVAVLTFLVGDWRRK